MAGRLDNERGAALVTVMLFMMLTFILITGMLAVTGNEVVISGIQRDSTRALEAAQAGIQEAIERMEEGRPYINKFKSSLDGTTDVQIFRWYTGVNSAYQEIRADATVGRGRRRLSALVFQQNITFPPNITFAASVIEQGSADIICGDAYARTFIQYKNFPSQAPGCTEPPALSYGGWRISKVAPGGVGPCYNHTQCVNLNAGSGDEDRWYPGQRRAENETTSLGQDIKAQTNKCPAGGGGLLPADTVTGIKADDPTGTTVNIPAYGFDTDDPDGIGLAPNQAVNVQLPCGLPYKWVAQTFQDELGNNVTRLMKEIVFEQWFANYWRFDEAKMKLVKRDGSACTYGVDAYCLSNNTEPNLLAYGQLGAVPPFPDMSSVDQNYNCKYTAGGVINSLPLNCADPPATTSDLGCYYPNMSCVPAVSRPVSMLLEGNYTINGTIKGHGTTVVNGDLTVNGNFEYWGTIIVRGVMTLGAGSAIIHGGLVADSTLNISGNIQVEGGGTISNAPTGRSIVLGRGWWER